MYLQLLAEFCVTGTVMGEALLKRLVVLDHCPSYLARIICFACYLVSQHDMPGSWFNDQGQLSV